MSKQIAFSIGGQKYLSTGDAWKIGTQRMTRYGKASMICLALAWLLSTTTQADPNEHQEGNTYKTVFPLTVAPYPCVSIQAKGARILLSRNELMTLSAGNASDERRTDERTAFLNRQRANKLLSKVSSQQDGFGCAMSTLNNTPDDNDALYVAAYLLEQGKAAVMRDGKRSTELRITVSHSNNQCSGSENFLFTDGKMFFSVPEWVV